MNLGLFLLGGLLMFYATMAIFFKEAMDAQEGRDTTGVVNFIFFVFGIAGAWCVLRALMVI